MTETFDGYLHPPRSSSRTLVEASVDDLGVVTLRDTSGTTLLSADWSELTLSPRVGNTARRISFPDGEMLETTDNDVVDTIDRSHNGTTTASLMHTMERLTYFTLIVLLISAAVAFSFFKWWLPAASDRAAMALSPAILDNIGHRSLQIMDRGVLAPSTLGDEDQALYQRQFSRLVAATENLKQEPELIFRSAPMLGPNAFALPDGTIVLTDEIIALSTHDKQIMGVLAHEISHVEGRHIMRRFLRSTSIAVIIVLITGDMAELTEMAIAIPAFMVEMGYSRDFEREADTHGMDLMVAIGEDPEHLADMFELMAVDCGDDCGNTWLSSHPDTLERIKSIRSR